MRTSLRLASLLCLSLVATLSAQRAANPRDAVLVTPAWLAAHLTDPNLVLLHVGDRAEYERTHIPGARYVGVDAISLSDRSGQGLLLEMPPADRLRDSLAALGISNDSRIVVYYGKDRVTQTTRVLFTLDYAGLGANARLLDGGMPAWTRDGHAVTSTPTPVRAGTLASLTTTPIVVDANYVRAHLGTPGVSIVDARAPSLFDGLQTGGSRDMPHKTGHIAGAKSVPFAEITDSLLALKPADQLASLFAKAGVQRGDTVVAYCHIGQQATATIFAARSLGFPVKLYDGSFEDWSRRDLPVENPAARGKP